MTHPEVTSESFIQRLCSAWRVLFPRAEALPAVRFPSAPTPFHPGGAPYRAAGPRVPPERRAPQPDEMCGFPLHLPFAPHGHVAIYGDLTECVDCGQAWDTNDPDPPNTCTPRRPLGGFNEDHIQ